MTEVLHPRRRRVWVLLVSALVVVGAVLAVTVAKPSGAEAPRSAPPPVGNVTKVLRGQLTADLTLVGTVRYDDVHSVASGRSGTVTAVPSSGQVVGQGGELYRVDDVPVLLLHGSLPAWRDFGAGMTDGPDVGQLETALSQLGFFSAKPDKHFSATTAAAVRAWQKKLGLKPTGTVPLGSVVFSAADLRVGAVKTPVGSQVGQGTAVLDVSAPTVSITADVSLPDQGDAPLGAHVEVQLPGGGTAQGTVSAVLPPAEREASGGTKVVVPIVVTLDDPSVVKGQDQLTVSLKVTRVVAKDVLQVPISALLALPDGGYGVQVRGANGQVRSVRVKLGDFGGGLVAVEGDLSEGDEVVTP